MMRLLPSSIGGKKIITRRLGSRVIVLHVLQMALT